MLLLVWIVSIVNEDSISSCINDGVSPWSIEVNQVYELGTNHTQGDCTNLKVVCRVGSMFLPFSVICGVKSCTMN